MGIDQTFVKEVLQEMEVLFTNKKSKKVKKSFDSLHGRSKSAFTKFSKKRKKGNMGKEEIENLMKNNIANKKQSKVIIIMI